MKTQKAGERKFFGKIYESLPLPDLIEIQKRSFDWFMKEGLKELFDEVSPIRDFIGRDLEIYFEKYYLDEPKFDEVTSKRKNLSFESPLRVEVRLSNKRTGKSVEQEVFLGDFPLMTERGTFVVNGVERVVVSQLIRSPGAFFTSQTRRGKNFFGAKSCISHLLKRI